MTRPGRLRASFRPRRAGFVPSTSARSAGARLARDNLLLPYHSTNYCCRSSSTPHTCYQMYTCIRILHTTYTRRAAPSRTGPSGRSFLLKMKGIKRGGKREGARDLLDAPTRETRRCKRRPRDTRQDQMRPTRRDATCKKISTRAVTQMRRIWSSALFIQRSRWWTQKTMIIMVALSINSFPNGSLSK